MPEGVGAAEHGDGLRSGEEALGDVGDEEEEAEPQQRVHGEERGQEGDHLRGWPDQHPVGHRQEPRGRQQREDEGAERPVCAHPRHHRSGDGESGHGRDGEHVGKADGGVEVESKVEAREVEGKDDGEDPQQVEDEQRPVRVRRHAAEEVEDSAEDESEDGSGRGDGDHEQVHLVGERAAHLPVKVQVREQKAAVHRGHQVRPHVERLVVQREQRQHAVGDALVVQPIAMSQVRRIHQEGWSFINRYYSFSFFHQPNTTSLFIVRSHQQNIFKFFNSCYSIFSQYFEFFL